MIENIKIVKKYFVKSRLVCRSRLFSGANCSPKTLKPLTSGLSSHSRSRSFVSVSRKRHVLCSEKNLELVLSVYHRFKRVVDYCTYHLEDTFTKYNRSLSKHVAKKAKWVTAQMETHVFNTIDPVSIVTILKNLRLLCYTIGVHEGRPVCFFYSSVRKNRLFRAQNITYC